MATGLVSLTTSLRESPKPKLFLGWSGTKSKAVAECVHRIIDAVFNHARPFVSSRSIEAEPWAVALENALGSAKLGAVFLSTENLHNPSIHFEMGVLLGREVPVFPFLIDLTDRDLDWPLNLFQAKPLQKDSVWALCARVASIIEEDLHKARERFDLLWEGVAATIALHTVESHKPQPALVTRLHSRHEMYKRAAEMIRNARQEVFDTTWGRPPKKQLVIGSKQRRAGTLPERDAYIAARQSIPDSLPFYDLIVKKGRPEDRVPKRGERVPAGYELVDIEGSIDEFPMPDFIVADNRYVLIAGYERDGTTEDHLVIDSPLLAEALDGWFQACVEKARSRAASREKVRSSRRKARSKSRSTTR